MAPNVSVLMTVYNGASFIKEAIDSVLNQTYKDFEFIVVDNASNDETPSLLKSYSDPRLCVLTNAVNLGQTKALNVGLAKAKGGYIARMDADDVSLPERLQKQVDYLDKNPLVAVVGSWHDEIDENGRFLKCMRYPTDPDQIRFHLLSDGNLTRRCLAHPTIMFRKEAVLDVGGYNESVKFAQDYDLWVRLVDKYLIGNTSETLLNYRVNKRSTSRENMAEMLSELDQIIGDHVQRIWPDILPRHKTMLIQMLRNKTVLDGPMKENIFLLFDKLVERYSGGRNLKNYVKIREKIKFYYLPRLFIKKPVYSFFYFIKTTFHFPMFLVDPKFFKNIGKLALN